MPHLFPLPLLFAFLSRLKILAGNEPALTQFFSVNPQNITLVHQLSWFLNSNLTLQLLNVILIIKRTSPRWFPMSHCKDPCVTAFCPVIGVSENPCLHYDCNLLIIIALLNTFSNDKKTKWDTFFIASYWISYPTKSHRHHFVLARISIEKENIVRKIESLCQSGKPELVMEWKIGSKTFHDHWTWLNQPISSQVRLKYYRYSKFSVLNRAEEVITRMNPSSRGCYPPFPFPLLLLFRIEKRRGWDSVWWRFAHYQNPLLRRLL